MKGIKQIGITLMFAFLLSTWSCNSSLKKNPKSTSTASEVTSSSVAALPSAIVYRTSGNYNNHVPVTLNSDGTAILSYPDPRDVASPNVTPIELENGYLLDRRGVNLNTAYLDYTYEEYAALGNTPSTKELMEHILAKNAITEMYRLPIKASEAIANPDICNKFITNGFNECTQLK